MRSKSSIRHTLAFFLCVVLAGLRVTAAAEAPPSLEELDADRLPASGSTITAVKPGRLAEKLGFRVGDVIVEINGTPVHHMDQVKTLLVADQPAAVRMVGQDGEARLINAHTGTLGFGFTFRYRPTLAVSRAMQRDPAWNDALIAAAWHFEQAEYRKAEKALARAAEAGYEPDALFHALSFGVALRLGQTDRADEMLRAVPNPGSESVFWTGPVAQYQLMQATGRASEAVEVVEAHPSYFPFAKATNWVEWARSIKETDHARDQPRQDDPLLGRERAMANEDLIPAERWQWARERVTLNNAFTRKGREGFFLSCSTGEYQQAVLTRDLGFRDFVLETTFTIKPNGERHPIWANNLLINIANYDYDNPTVEEYFAGRVTLLGLSIEETTTIGCFVSPMLGWDSKIRWAHDEFDGVTEHHLTISRTGSRGRIVLDGVVLVDLPVDEDVQHLMLHVHNVGMQVDFSKFVLADLEPAAE